MSRSTAYDRPVRIDLATAEPDYDVAIVGARIAGSVLASYLGDRGWRVLLADRATFPSTTISTHFFRGGGLVGVLDELGLLPAALALGAPPLVRQYDYASGSRDAVVGPPQDPGSVGYCLSVRREPLDALLVDRADGCSSVTVVEGALAASVATDGRDVTGLQVRSGEAEREIGARLVVGADGHSSTIARLVDAPIQEDAGRVRGCFYGYVSGFPGPSGGPPDGPEFSLAGDEMAYVFPSDAGIACIALSVTLDVFAEMRGGGMEGFSERLRRHPGLSDRFEAAHPVSGLLGRGPQANVVRVPYGPGWALVGDAGMQQDAWTGLGMDNAGIHARALGRRIHEWLSGSRTREDALAAYHADRDDHALGSFHDTVEFGRDLRQLA